MVDFIKALSKDNAIYLYSFYNPFEDRHAYQQVFRYCAKIRRVHSWNSTKNLVYIRGWLKDISIDIVHYEWPESLINYDPSLGKVHIFTYMEAVSLRLLMEISKESPLSLLWIDKLKKLIHYLKIELVDASVMDARVAVTTKDAEFFKSLVPELEYTILNHGVNMNEFCLPDVKPMPYTLVYVGNFLHPPNGDAVRFFFDSIWENVLQNVPQTKIYIVGAHPPKWIKLLSKQRNVFVTGEVSDIRPYIQRASICIAPLISGAGLRGKVIQYASLRRTFVATSIAVSDLALVDGSDYLKANTGKEFSESLLALLKDGERARKMGLRAYETVVKYYDSYRLTNYLLRIYDRLDERMHV